LTTPLDNHGERLVPGESHDTKETIRHKSSYRFFKAIIEADVARVGSRQLRILDLGCGVGHGSRTLAEIPDCQVVGIDASADAIDYAQLNYSAPNISFYAATAQEYQKAGEAFDYIVSRHALEHIPGGLSLALQFRFSSRLIVNVPYLEPAHDEDDRETNPHHELNDISEKDFAAYPHREFFYEDLAGQTKIDPESANSIICVSNASDLPPISSLIQLPFEPWAPNRLEQIGLRFDIEIAKVKEEAAENYDALQLQYDALKEQHQLLLDRRSVKAALKLAAFLSNFK
jgi:SAM-dependent methyltransferase